MKSIKWKLIAIYLGLVFIVMIVSGTFMILRIRQQETNKIKEDLTSYSQYIYEQVITGNGEENFQEALTEFTKRSSVYSAFQGNVINAHGQTLATTAYTAGNMPQFNNKIIVESLASGNESFSDSKWERNVLGVIREWVSYCRPVTKGDRQYVIFVQADAGGLQDSMSKTFNTLTLSLAIALFLTMIIGYIFASTLTVPISVLTSNAKELAQGNLNRQIEVRSKDEIGQLTESFNFMSRELNITMSAMSKEKNKLETILQNMTDGVLSFDTEGNLIHANNASYEILVPTDGEPLTFSSFVKKYDINSSVLLDDYETKEVLFQVGAKYINAGFAPFADEKGNMSGIIVVLQDFTEQKRLDDMRKEFVANVSHELRTPLTTVKSYTETLLDGGLEEEMTKEFLQIINSETDRMAVLVSDLLQLSRFDNEQFDLKKDTLYLKDFITQKIYQNKIHAENKNQTITLSLHDENAFIVADSARATQALNNIIINAIKYSGENTTIQIFTTTDGFYTKIHVKDAGMGIPKSDLPRIFERFYRVDKARSRSMGGTGLGLAIASDIMNAHGGKITAESCLGYGTTMTLWFAI